MQSEEIDFHQESDIDRIVIIRSEELSPKNLEYDSSGAVITEKAIVIPIPILHSLVQGKPVKFHKAHIDYNKDHFIDLAFAITFHKEQEKTLKKIVPDINPKPGKNVAYPR